MVKRFDTTYGDEKSEKEKEFLLSVIIRGETFILKTFNAPKRARTSNHLVRSQVLYPIELSVPKTPLRKRSETLETGELSRSSSETQEKLPGTAFPIFRIERA